MPELQKNSMWTYFDGFEFQGKFYKLNTIVKVKPCVYMNQYRIGYLYKYPMVQLVYSYLDSNGTHRWSYAIWMHSGNIIHYTTKHTPDEIIESIVEVPSEKATEENSEYYKDSEVKGMFFGWFMYILGMIVVSVFKEAIIGWVVITIYFFLWRGSKLRKPNKVFYGINAYEKVREWND